MLTISYVQFLHHTGASSNDTIDVTDLTPEINTCSKRVWKNIPSAQTNINNTATILPRSNNLTRPSTDFTSDGGKYLTHPTTTSTSEEGNDLSHPAMNTTSAADKHSNSTTASTASLPTVTMHSIHEHAGWVVLWAVITAAAGPVYNI